MLKWQMDWLRERIIPQNINKQLDLPRISIVTPSYNQGQYIEETIRSVLLQGYPYLEYIVIDGGSQDETISILNRYRPFLDIVVIEADKGQADAINKGFSRCTGKIMGWLNSDDILEPNALFRIAQAFMAYPDTAFITGFRRIYDQDSDFIRNWIRDFPITHYLRHYCCIAQETTYWRRSAWEALGALDATLHCCFDYEYWLRAMQAGYTFKLLPHYLGGYRDHPATKTATMRATYETEIAVVYQRYCLALNEADALRGLGFEWWLKQELILTLTQIPLISDNPRLMLFLLQLFEHPVVVRIGATILNKYGHYMARLPFSIGKKLLALCISMGVAVLKQSWKLHPVEPPHDTRHPLTEVLHPSQTGLPVTAFLDKATLETYENLPTSAIIFGNGWHQLERDSHGLIFCWATARAQLIITHPSPHQQHLRLLIEPGPSLNYAPFDLLIVSDDEQIIDRKHIHNRTRIQLDLSAMPDRVQFLYLQVENPERAIPLHDDGRVYLYYRLLEAAWDNE